MSKSGSWTETVLKALKALRADERPASLEEVYRAVKEIAPSRCDDSDVYERVVRGRKYSEPRWRRNVRDALVKLKKRGLVVAEGQRLWKLASPQT